MVRASVRGAGAVAAGAVAVLLVSGCGSSQEDGDGKSVQDGAVETVKPPEEHTGPDSSGPVTLQGVWNTEVDGAAHVLTVAGSRASLLRDGELCTGGVAGDEKQKLSLECPGGTGEERTDGAVEDLRSASLEVSWNGGDTDTYTRVTGAPEELPGSPEELENLLPEG